MSDTSKSSLKDQVQAALTSWENADTGSYSDLNDRGDELYDALRRVQAAYERTPEIEPVLPPETYTASGLPRRAMSRAREHGARLTHSLGGGLHRVVFPDGSAVESWSAGGARRNGKALGRVHNRYRGAAPDALTPEGDTLEDVLNNFADAEEGRR